MSFIREPVELERAQAELETRGQDASNRQPHLRAVAVAPGRELMRTR